MPELVHRAEQVTPDVVALSCHACRRRYSGDELAVILDLGAAVDLQCPDPECGAGGMIAHRISRLDERFPAILAGRFTPLPEALLDHAATLGLGPHELVVVWALERHRRLMGDEVFPKRTTLIGLTRLSEGQLKRAMRHLVSSGLVQRRQPWEDKRPGRNRYGLDPLWNRLAELEESVGHGRPTVGTSTVGHQRPTLAENADEGHQRPADRGSPATRTVGHQRPTEVEAVQGDADRQGDPAGPRPAAPAHGAAWSLRRNPRLPDDLDTGDYLMPKAAEG